MTLIFDPQGNNIGIRELDAWHDQPIYHIYEYAFSAEYLLQSNLIPFLQIFPHTFSTDIKMYIFDSIIHQRLQEEIFLHEISETIFYFTTNYDELDSINSEELIVDLDDLFAELADLVSTDDENFTYFSDLIADLNSD